MKTIERLRELEKKATPIWGVPSTVRESDLARGTTHVFHAKTIGEVVVTFADEATARHYIELRRSLPALLAVVEAQAAEIEAWREGHDADNDDGGPALVYDLTIDPDYAIDFGKRLTAACDKTDAAIREMEGGAG